MSMLQGAMGVGARLRAGRQWVWVAVGVVLVLLLWAVVVPVLRERRPARRPAPAALRPEPTISLFITSTGTVRRLGMEDYLAGVVAGEVEPDWPEPVLRAQAIVARTFTVRKMREGPTVHGTDASTDPKEFQAYTPEKVTPAVRRAVQATRGRVLLHRGQPIQAYFHACAGGMTATPAEAGLPAGPAPYLRVLRDPACPPRLQTWQASFGPEEVVRAIRQTGVVSGSPPTVGGVDRVAVVARGTSGRATRLRLGPAVVDAVAFRAALGPDRMKSTLLESLHLEEGGRLVMRGRGWGHGVGLSQWGAFALARRGWDEQRILRHYFPGTEIGRLWR